MVSMMHSNTYNFLKHYDGISLGLGHLRDNVGPYGRILNSGKTILNIQINTDI